MTLRHLHANVKKFATLRWCKAQSVGIFGGHVTRPGVRRSAMLRLEPKSTRQVRSPKTLQRWCLGLAKSALGMLGRKSRIRESSAYKWLVGRAQFFAIPAEISKNFPFRISLFVGAPWRILGATGKYWQHLKSSAFTKGEKIPLLYPPQ